MRTPRVRFTIRGMMVVVAVVGATCGALAWVRWDLAQGARWICFTSPLWAMAAVNHIPPRALRAVPYLVPAALVAGLVAPKGLMGVDHIGSGFMFMAMWLATFLAWGVSRARLLEERQVQAPPD